ncbi:hypothetical protein CC341_13770 [Salmonella enterica subsp. enterica serovar Apeyeme]|nr:hypothetical protein [Salmonella enterica subsp. enterica]EDH7494043.1 hypothetical protein [Salmonella enterica]EDH9099960.1 hypothetical protein [Salmonella enterica subsp. enterica serovar Apeyeme]
MLSLFWQITPHFEGIGAIKMVLSGFPHCRFSKKSMGYVIVQICTLPANAISRWRKYQVFTERTVYQSIQLPVAHGCFM